MNHGEGENKHFHRFHGYDYSRGAAMMITIVTEPRRPLFGTIRAAKLVKTPLGDEVEKSLVYLGARVPGLRLYKYIVMPDHIHLRVYLEKGLPDPLVVLGGFIRRFKTWSTRCWKRQAELAALDGGAVSWTRQTRRISLDGRAVSCSDGRPDSRAPLGGLWQKNYHDWILPSREIISLADKYIENNPLKWSLMHGNPPPLKVVEPICAAAIPAGEWWSGIGRVDWLSDPSMKFAAVRLSRSIPHAEVKAVCDRLIKAAEKGYVLAGTWISPCERILFEELVRRELPIVKGAQDPLAMVYRPKGDETRLFGDGRLLILSRVFAEGTARGVGWHGINDALGKIAKAAGGESVYVRWNPGEGVKWDFAK